MDKHLDACAFRSAKGRGVVEDVVCWELPGILLAPTVDSVLDSGQERLEEWPKESARIALLGGKPYRFQLRECGASPIGEVSGGHRVGCDVGSHETP